MIYTRRDLPLLAAFAGILLCVYGPYRFEPRSDLEYEDVTVLSHLSGGRYPGSFSVRSLRSGGTWKVKDEETRGDFPPDYTGPAVLAISRGRWTGKLHFELYRQKPAN
jgi:hypothetical protein